MDLKKIYNKMPCWIKNISGKIGRYRIIYSKEFKKQYALLNLQDKLSQSDINKEQLKELKKLLIYAYENTDYYHELFDKINFNPVKFNNLDQFQSIPYLTKDIIRDNGEKILSKAEKNFYYATTGGSSGKPIKIAFSYQSLYRERAFVYHYWSKFGYDYKTSRLITFREVEFNGKIVKYNPLYNEMIINPFLLNSNNIENILKRIQKFNGQFLYGYPSTIAAFSHLLLKNNRNIDCDVKAIFLISENLYKDQDLRIRKVFKCPIAMFYGHTEKAVFAEAYNDKYFFNPLYGYTEIIESEEDNIVCTGFINSKMPLIRYRADDKATHYKDGYKIQGHRESDVLYGLDDYSVSATAIEFTHVDCFEKIDAYQFEQNEIGKVTLRLETDQRLSHEEYNCILEDVKQRLPSFDVKIEFVNRIERTRRGKYKLIVQNISDLDV